MNNDTIQWLLIISFPFIAFAAFLKAYKESKNKFGSEYMEVVTSFQWKCAKGLALISLYCALSVFQGGWEKLLSGIAFSAAAFTFATMTIHEMACAISINHNIKITKSKIALISRSVIILQAIALTTLILVFQSQTAHWAATAFQIILLAISLILFYGIGSVINLIRVSYKPSDSSV